MRRAIATSHPTLHTPHSITSPLPPALSSTLPRIQQFHTTLCASTSSSSSTRSSSIEASAPPRSSHPTGWGTSQPRPNQNQRNDRSSGSSTWGQNNNRGSNNSQSSNVGWGQSTSRGRGSWRDQNNLNGRQGGGGGGGSETKRNRQVEFDLESMSSGRRYGNNSNSFSNTDSSRAQGNRQWDGRGGVGGAKGAKGDVDGLKTLLGLQNLGAGKQNGGRQEGSFYRGGQKERIDNDLHYAGRTRSPYQRYNRDGTLTSHFKAGGVGQTQKNIEENTVVPFLERKVEAKEKKSVGGNPRTGGNLKMGGRSLSEDGEVEADMSEMVLPNVALFEEDMDSFVVERGGKRAKGKEKGKEKEKEKWKGKGKGRDEEDEEQFVKKKKVYVSRSQQNRAMEEGYGGRELLNEVQEKKFKEKKEKKETKKEEPKKPNYKLLEIPRTITLEQFSRLVKLRFKELLKRLDKMGIDDWRADRQLTAEDASLIAQELGFEPVIDEEASFDVYPDPPCTDPSLLEPRPPIVTIMGHVDHGKTSLLDALRNARVAKGEAGGITQHIGAFTVSLAEIRRNSALKEKENDESVDVPKEGSKGEGSEETYDKITFLDTPGHEAFSSMRARGASVTDVVVLVVAADDGVMPQTEEVIGLLKKERQGEGLGIVIAITKIDKPEAMVEDVKNQLMGEDLRLEEFGGDIPCVEVSAVTGQGMKELVETIATIAELKEIKTERTGVRAQGWVLEAKKDPKRGITATILNTRGTMRFASHLIAGNAYGRIREMTLSTGEKASQLLPGQAAEVTGWRDLPEAGDEVIQSYDVNSINKALKNRLRREERLQALKDLEIIEIKRKEESKKQEAVESLKKEWWKSENQKEKRRILDQMEKDEEEERAKVKELILVIKADFMGSVEAVVGALENIGNEKAKVKIVEAAVGNVTESDFALAEAVGGTIIGFNVSVPKSVVDLNNGAAKPIKMHTDTVIYRLIEVVREGVMDLLPQEYGTKIVSESEIQQIFKYNLKKKTFVNVAGCKVMNGTFYRNKVVRVVRGEEVVFEGELSSMKFVKKEVEEAKKNSECGVTFEGFEDFKVGDKILGIERFELPKKL